MDDSIWRIWKPGPALAARVARVLVVSGLLVGGCATGPVEFAGPGTSNAGSHDGAATQGRSCDALLERAIERTLVGGDASAPVERLAGRCPAEYKIFTDYSSMKAMAGIGEASSVCPDPSELNVSPEAVERAERDGLCSSEAGGDVSDAGWTCVYSPSLNDDWHDDVLCSNGFDQERPRLREWDSFVTEDEIMESAREYEAALNGG